MESDMLFQDYQKCKSNLQKIPNSSPVYAKLILLSSKIDQNPNDHQNEQRLFVELAGGIVIRKNSDVLNYIRKSVFYFKEALSKNWRQKILIVDYSQKTIQIVDEVISSCELKVSDFNRLNANWLGPNNEKFCFSLEREGRLNFKKFFLGFDSEEKAKEWYDLIQKMIKKKSQVKQKCHQETVKCLSDSEDPCVDDELTRKFKLKLSKMNSNDIESGSNEEFQDFNDISAGEKEEESKSKFVEHEIKDKFKVVEEDDPLFSLISKNEFIPIHPLEKEKLLECIKKKEHLIRCIKQFYLMQPINYKNPKFQSISEETGGHYILNNYWTREADGYLYFHNKPIIDAQRRVMGYLLKKLGSNIIQGKSIMNISMPVDIFDKSSFLERIAYSFTNAPLFLERAAQSDDLLYQMKMCSGFLISLLHMSLNQEKPFNPILGETFQGRINGSPIYLEQISHHPPISAILMIGKGYRVEGNFEVVAALRPNSMSGKQLGSADIVFSNRRISFSMPICEINGFSFGPRYLNYSGKCLLLDKENMMAAEFIFNPDKKGFIKGWFVKQQTPSDHFEGGIYKVNTSFIKRIESLAKLNEYGGINKKNDVIQEVSNANGVWHEFLNFGEECIWNIKRDVAYQLEYEHNPLPSDSIYREDSITWKFGNIENAQAKKEMMENDQRADRKLREKLGKQNR